MSNLPVILQELDIDIVYVLPALRQIKGSIVPGRLLNKKNAMVISANQSETEKLLTFIHELLHLLRPEWSEAKIRIDEHRICAILNLLRFCIHCQDAMI